MTDHRVPIGHATYNGDQSHLAGRSESMGPNYMGELMWPVTADYDAASNKTRVSFSLLAPEVSTDA